MASFFLASLLNALTMGGVDLIDAVMMDGCYKNKSMQPLIVSCLLGPLFYVLAHFIFIPLFHVPKVGIPIGAAIFALVSGVVYMGANFCYFKALAAQSGISSDVSAHSVTSPVVVILLLQLLQFVGFGISQSLSAIQVGAIFLVVFGHILWKTFEQHEKIHWKTRLFMLGLPLFHALHLIIFDYGMELVEIPAGLSLVDQKRAAIFALYPYFWIGFVLGIGVIFFKGEYQAFKENFRNVVSYWKAILAAEFLGFMAFASQLYSLGGQHPAIADVLGRCKVFVVFFGAIALRRYFGVSEEIFPPKKTTRKKFAALLLIVGGVVIAKLGGG